MANSSGTTSLITTAFACLAVGALLLTACGGDDASEGRASITPPSSTPTLDLRQAVGVQEAIEQRLAIPNVGETLQATHDGDVEALLQLIDWQPQLCGLPHGHTDACPAGVEPQSEMPMFNVGEDIAFWATEETLRLALAATLDEPVELVFASRFKEPGRPYRNESERDIYYLGFEGAPRAVGASVLWGDATTRTGIFLSVDFASDEPIVGLVTLREDWSAAQQAAAWGLAGHEIITLGP